MAKKTLEEILEKVKDFETEENREKYISLIEDISDSMANDNSSIEELQRRYKELEEKYVNRFFQKNEVEEKVKEEEKEEKEDELLTEKEIENIMKEELLNG